MNVAKRIALAMKGTREERAILIRDPNRIVTVGGAQQPEDDGHRDRRHRPHGQRLGGRAADDLPTTARG